MRKILMFGHGGSGNHGCEAIVRTTSELIKNVDKRELFSIRPYEDRKYGIEKICNINSIFYKMKYPMIEKGLLKLKNKVTGRNYNNVNKFKKFYRSCDKNSIALSIGGDNYCYPHAMTRKMLPGLNRNAQNNGAKTVLWGCSIEPEILSDSLIEEISEYNLITTRESLTYKNLKEKGLGEKVKMCPDTGFNLKKVELPLPRGFIENETVGLNLSPLIQRRERKKGITFKNFSSLINYIINNTDMNVALIPHVIWNHDNDLIALNKLLDLYKDNERVILINDCNCMEIKGYISRLKMFIGARTHATIAAYSTNIPTLAIGYSVKAKGIAEDLFDSYEDMVIPVQSLKEEDDIIKGFEYLEENEASIKKQLKSTIPQYSENIGKINTYLDNISGK